MKVHKTQVSPLLVLGPPIITAGYDEVLWFENLKIKAAATFCNFNETLNLTAIIYFFPN